MHKLIRQGVQLVSDCLERKEAAAALGTSAEGEDQSEGDADAGESTGPDSAGAETAGGADPAVVDGMLKRGEETAAALKALSDRVGRLETTVKGSRGEGASTKKLEGRVDEVEKTVLSLGAETDGLRDAAAEAVSQGNAEKERIDEVSVAGAVRAHAHAEAVSRP